MGQNLTGMKGPPNWYGPNDSRLAWCQWAPNGSATQTILDGAGVTSVVRNSIGLWTITLLHKPLSIIGVDAQAEVANAGTLFSRAQHVATSIANKTVQVTFRSVAFASVASGDAPSDTVTMMRVLIAMRMNP